MFCFSFKGELDTKECRISNRKNVKSIVKSCFVTLWFLSLTINCTGIWQVQLPLVHCKYSNQIYIETKTVNTKNRDDKTQNTAQKALDYVSKIAPSHMSTSFTGLMMCIVKCYIFDLCIFQKNTYLKRSILLASKPIWAFRSWKG